MVRVAILLSVLSGLSAGCGGASPAAQPPTPVPVASSVQPTPGASEADATRPSLTALACEESGGTLVGDIGDGAIHRPEYRCPNGAKPTGSIRAEEAAPTAIEGSVCCPR